MLRRLAARVRLDHGFTLVEVLVVMAITAAMTLVTMQLVTNMFSANIRAGQQFDQQTSAEQFSGFMVSRLAAAQRPIGILKGTKIDPLSLAGDQIVFPYAGKCVRVFYLERSYQIRATVGDESDSESCIDTLRVKRGPNQVRTGHSSPNDPARYTASEGDDDYDPGLDDGTGAGASFLLIDKVVKAPPVNAPSGSKDPLIIFGYLADGSRPGSTLDYISVDDRASSESTNNWYNDVSNRDDIASVDVIAYLSGGRPGSSYSDAAQTRYFLQNIALQQLASTSSRPAGYLLSQGQVSASSSGSPTTMAQGSFDTVSLGDGNPLQTPALAAKTAWLDFSGQVTVCPENGANFAIRARLEADSGSGFSAASDANGRSYYDYSATTSSDSAQCTNNRRQAIPLSGAFKLPASSDQLGNGTTFRIKVYAQEISNVSGGLKYEPIENLEWLNYRLVAR